MKLKVCGMKYSDNIQEVAALDPNYLGFIFYSGSPRFMSEDLPEIGEEIIRTGVFVNTPLEEVSKKIKEHNLGAIQLHGEETPQYCVQLRQQMLPEKRPVEIWKVFSIGHSFDFSILRPYESKVDYFLFDTSGKERGGTGKVFNWELLLEYDSPTPFILSGGIGLEEAGAIRELVKQLEEKGRSHLLYGIDVNSRFESEPGRKKIEELIEFRKSLEGVLDNKTENKK